jgi:DNA/RNA-binding domain of Phe-tRNA-synthetase-like protein
MAFLIDKSIWELFSGMHLVVASGRNLDNETDKPAVKQFLSDVQEELRSGWRYQNAQSHPFIDTWRQAFKRMGISSKKFPSSIEALCRRVLSGGVVININPFVDFYNAISLQHLVPAGGWDIDDIYGEHIFLRLTQGGERFTELGQWNATSVEPGEVSYTDSDELITRHFVWRQSETGKIDPTTKRFFFVSEILPELGRDVAEQVRQTFVEGFAAYFGTPVTAAILPPKTLQWDWE